jgi:hypothetical protein
MLFVDNSPPIILLTRAFFTLKTYPKNNQTKFGFELRVLDYNFYPYHQKILPIFYLNL